MFDAGKTALSITFMLAVCSSSFLLTPAYAAIIAPNDTNIQHGGRWDWTDANGPKSQWPGSYIKAWFQGTSVTVNIETAGDLGHHLFIDDKHIKN